MQDSDFMCYFAQANTEKVWWGGGMGGAQLYQKLLISDMTSPQGKMILTYI